MCRFQKYFSQRAALLPAGRVSPYLGAGLGMLFGLMTGATFYLGR